MWVKIFLTHSLRIQASINIPDGFMPGIKYDHGIAHLLVS